MIHEWVSPNVGKIFIFLSIDLFTNLYIAFPQVAEFGPQEGLQPKTYIIKITY